MISDYQAAVLVNLSFSARAALAIGAVCGGLVGAVVRLTRGRRPGESSGAGRRVRAFGRIAADLAAAVIETALPAAYVSALVAMAVSAVFVAHFPNNSGYFEVADWAAMLQITVVLMTSAAMALCLHLRPGSTARTAAAAMMWLLIGGIVGAGLTVSRAFGDIAWRWDDMVVLKAATRGAMICGPVGAVWRIIAEVLSRRRQQQVSQEIASPETARVAESPWD